MGEGNGATDLVVYIEGKSIGHVSDLTLPEIAAAEDESLPVIAGMAATEISASFTVMLSAMLESFRRAVSRAVPFLESITAAYHAAGAWDTALAAAERSRPRWAHFYKHTKKKRTRKKYMDRILRWYLEEVAGHGAAAESQ